MYLWFYILRPKRVVLFPEIAWIEFFLSLTCPHSRMCIRIYILNFKKQTSKTTTTTKKARIQKKQKKLKKKTISLENRLKEKLRPSR